MVNPRDIAGNTGEEVYSWLTHVQNNGDRGGGGDVVVVFKKNWKKETVHSWNCFWM